MSYDGLKTFSGYSFVQDMSIAEAMAAYVKQRRYIEARVYTPDDRDIFEADCEYLRVLAARARWTERCEQFIAGELP